MEDSGARVVCRGSADPTGPWGSEMQNDKESGVQHLEKAVALLEEWERWGTVLNQGREEKEVLNQMGGRGRLGAAGW